MFDASLPLEDPPTRSARSQRVPAAVKALHDRCGIYTKAEVVERVLDAIGWTANADLSKARLLEPAAGDGSFLVAAASRLVASARKRRLPLDVASLGDRICAFEIHSREAQRARDRVISVLAELKVSARTRNALSKRWVTTGDFLLSDIREGSFSHVAGNPPYARWSRIPASLRKKYEVRLPRRMAKGDLFLPFLDLSIGYLKQGGRLGFVCSNRWRYMAFAEDFRRERLPAVEIEQDTEISADDAYVSAVDAYPSILVLKRVAATVDKLKAPSVKRPRTLKEAGNIVRVGPALGGGSAFVLGPDEDDVEPELLVPWITGSEIEEGAIKWSGRHVIAIYDDDGNLRRLRDYPRLTSRLRRYRSLLKQRAIVAAGAPWYRTIDRVIRADWSRPKLVLPELAKIPRIAVDLSGAVPSHGVYAIFAPDDDIERLYEIFGGGRLAAALKGVSPRVKGEYVRCYRRFLLQLQTSGA